MRILSFTNSTSIKVMIATAVVFCLMGVTSAKAYAANLWTDSFTRSVSGAWGSSEGSGYTAYSLYGDGDVDGSVGTMDVTSAGSANQVAAFPSLFANSDGDQDIHVKFKMDKVPTATNESHYVMLSGRYHNANGEYRARLRACYCTGAVRLKYVGVSIDDSNNETIMGSEITAPGNFSADEWWHARFQVVGYNPTTINIKAWKDGDSEPDSWVYSTTDSTESLQNDTGRYAILSRVASGSTILPVLFSFDDYTVDSL